MLLDLPDHDSTEVAHHVEVDRLVKLADLLVWVLDPQKYADAAIHERYLRPLAIAPRRHARGAQPHRRGRRRPGAPAMVADLRRLLAEDGLGDVPVIATSARHGDGIPELSGAIAAAGRREEGRRRPG